MDDQSPADAATLTAAANTGQLKARIRAYPFYTIGADAWDAAGVKPGDGDRPGDPGVAAGAPRQW